MTVRECAKIWVEIILLLSGRSFRGGQEGGLKGDKGKGVGENSKFRCDIVGVPECLTRPAGSYRQLTFTLAVVSLHQAVDYYR